jgi:hypothetical protein
LARQSAKHKISFKFIDWCQRIANMRDFDASRVHHGPFVQPDERSCHSSDARGDYITAPNNIRQG